MKIRNTPFTLLLTIIFLLSACGTPLQEDAMKENATEEGVTHEAMPSEEAMTDKETPSEEAMEENKAELPAWFSTPLTNVRTGASFSIQDFKGKVILVETMAVWCSNCREQQGQVVELHNLLGSRDDFVSIGLDIDPNENVEQLRNYVDNQGFHWLYAISTVDVSRALSDLYGVQFLNPPSTPMLAIDRHGGVHPLPFGVKNADELLQFIQPFLDEPM